ncbi:hypothetical protein [Bartonella tribocorum]|uniref:Integrase n=1 Tax=Bartonella tribocorum (strain DSM 28219 / CCUG 45778 / CIP 105476 / IBS 506) TaxID=382640 RepID=A9IYB4_BART1|nr:hypothetical protein [Bartonella tribocorum]CAK02331.1 Integrase [Bartonella tribocorum CIP 105476]
MDNTVSLLHKYKNGSAQWLYHYTIHSWRREMGVTSIKTCFLKKARELATG